MDDSVSNDLHVTLVAAPTYAETDCLATRLNCLARYLTPLESSLVSDIGLINAAHAELLCPRPEAK